jgi:hypothetical protein
MLGWRVHRLLRAKGGPCYENPRGKPVIGVDSDNPVVPRVADGAAGVAVAGVDSTEEVVVAAEAKGRHCYCHYWSKGRMMVWAGGSRYRGHMMRHG